MADAAPTDGAQPESCPAATAGIALASAEPAGGRGMSGPEESRDTPPAAAAGAGGQSSQESDPRAEAAANAAASAATPPEADADDADDDDDDGYVAPPAADISEVRDAGKGHPEDDESMKRYKEALLGPDASSGPGAPLVVEILELRLEHGAGPGAASEDAGPTLSVALGGSAAEAAAAAPLTVKGGGWRRVSIRFRVRGQIVHGLKLKMRIRGATSGIQLERATLMLGSYAPKAAEQVYAAPPTQYPGHIFARGTYIADCEFVDDAGNQHLAFTYRFVIGRKWDWDHPAVVKDGE
ncbi:hypothetical protein FNF29_07313 [Cafeteria roenbergensis]|uniref:Rho GDP-dissociation inhibitor 1 n=1 Tax=Cafeteria roenbergensis TaxID=33653 RepID=A0A5A8C476_CAFRO|nr:hypothetical protein FNF29_07313 [Cafeteria roenbergensis]|eukprot:KAA0147467.1 hypothetical protein FNF29_07313 [Cafeteria roenbergensis]